MNRKPEKQEATRKAILARCNRVSGATMREVLADLCWPDDTEQAQKAAHRMLYRVRNTLIEEGKIKMMAEVKGYKGAALFRTVRGK